MVVCWAVQSLLVMYRSDPASSAWKSFCGLHNRSSRTASWKETVLARSSLAGSWRRAPRSRPMLHGLHPCQIFWPVLQAIIPARI